MRFPTPPTPLEEPDPIPAWDVKDLYEYLREATEGDSPLELEDFFSFVGQDLDA